MTPPLAPPGLYRGLLDLKASIERYRAAPPEQTERARATGRADSGAGRGAGPRARRNRPGRTPRLRSCKLTEKILELEYALIPDGLHVVGAAADARSAGRHAGGGRRGRWRSAARPARRSRRWPGGETPEQARRWPAPTAATSLPLLQPRRARPLLAEDHELAGADPRARRPLHPPGAGRRHPALARRAADRAQPARLRPVPHAVRLRDEGRRAAGREAARAPRAETGELPKTVAMVLWGADNLKTEGVPMAQVLALMGARPRIDGYGRVCGAELCRWRSWAARASTW
jgi:magnesium chelatase subunit H